MKKPLISIIIVTFNSDEYLDNCLKSVFKNSYKNFEVILYDNNSTDKSKVIINKYKKNYSNRVISIFSKENIGYAKANNTSVELAHGEYIFILNPDTLVDENFLEPLLFEMNKKNVIAVQPLVYLFDKKTINLTGKVTHYLGFDWLKDFKSKVVPLQQQIYSMSGSGILLNKNEFLDLGGFDDLYFMYYEDTDLSWKINLVGKKIVFTPNSILYHDYKYTPKENNQPLINKLYYIERNRIITILKNYSSLTLLLLSPVLIFMELGMVAYSFYEGWGPTKLQTYVSIIRNFSIIIKKRKFIQDKRTIRDRNIFKHLESRITFVMFSNPVIQYVVNPVLFVYFWIFKTL
jgi:GT2 family glycosyltransferase